MIMTSADSLTGLLESRVNSCPQSARGRKVEKHHLDGKLTYTPFKGEKAMHSFRVSNFVHLFWGGGGIIRRMERYK